MRRIAERVGQSGLKGFCPVALRDDHELIDSRTIFTATYEAKKYCFSSAEAKARFISNPTKYAPVAQGIDVVVKANSDQVVEGTLDFAVWYKDRLYLFSSPESMEAFALNPQPYATPFLKGR
jgi:YHS domain-containing protein